MRTTALALIACLTLALIAPMAFAEGSAAKTKEDGFKKIFNGKDLTGWEGDPTMWSVKDGCIVGESTDDNPAEYNTFLIWRGGEVSDFVLKLSYKLRNHNTGIQYRSKDILDNDKKWDITGYQADIADPGWIPGICYEEKGRGILAKQGQKVKIGADGKIEVVEQFATEEAVQKKIKPNGEWNHYEVIVKGNHAIHIINGQITSEVIDEQPEKAMSKGLIAFQLHTGPAMKVEFKDIRVKNLKADGSAKK